MTVAVMMQRAAFLERNADHGLLGSSRRLRDGFRHFARLAMAEADAALAVAHDDQSREAEALGEQTSPKSVAQRRGKKIADLLGRGGSNTAEADAAAIAE
jgi:hypothetical protein